MSFCKKVVVTRDTLYKECAHPVFADTIKIEVSLIFNIPVILFTSESGRVSFFQDNNPMNQRIRYLKAPP